MSEILIPGFNFNNNFNKTKASDDEEIIETEDHFDGVLAKEQYDGSDLIDNDDHHEQSKEDTDCKMCNQSPCLSGLFLTESIKDPVGLRVKATGDSWAASKYKNNYHGKCGTVVSCKLTKMNNFLNILWEHKKPRRKHKMKTSITNYLAKGEPKFTIECKPHPGSLPSATYNAPPEDSQPQESPCSNNANLKPNNEKKQRK